MFCPSLVCSEVLQLEGQLFEVETLGKLSVGIKLAFLDSQHHLHQHVSFVWRLVWGQGDSKGAKGENVESTHLKNRRLWPLEIWNDVHISACRRLIWIEWWQNDMREESSQKLQPSIEGWVLLSTGIRLSQLTTSDGLAHTGLWDAGVAVTMGTFIRMSILPVSSSDEFQNIGIWMTFLGLESFLFAAQPRVKRVQIKEHRKSLPGFAFAKMEGCLFFLWQPLFEFYWPDAPNRMEWHGMIGRNWLGLTSVDLVIDST